MDDQGMAPSPELLRTSPRFIFVTPSHQYPLGLVMGVARRRMLLAHAHRHNTWIIEDDYDSEFRFEGRPLASLQGLDRYDRVLYLGTFSKTLYPGCAWDSWLSPNRWWISFLPPFLCFCGRATCNVRRCWPVSSRNRKRGVRGKGGS